MILWRIASEGQSWKANDMSGISAGRSGGRWNSVDHNVIYSAPSVALTVLETVVHIDPTGFPLNRFLVQITVPDEAWTQREIFDIQANGGWDAHPAGMTSISAGDEWLRSGRSLLMEVPSVIVPEECNVLINPAHPDIANIKASTIRKWIYDHRFHRK